MHRAGWFCHSRSQNERCGARSFGPCAFVFPQRIAGFGCALFFAADYGDKPLFSGRERGRSPLPASSSPEDLLIKRYRFMFLRICAKIQTSRPFKIRKIQKRKENHAMKKRILSLLLALMMVLPILTLQLYASLLLRKAVRYLLSVLRSKLKFLSLTMMKRRCS